MPGMSKVSIRGLEGEYGPFTVKKNDIQIKCTDLTTGKPCTKAKKDVIVEGTRRDVRVVFDDDDQVDDSHGEVAAPGKDSVTHVAEILNAIDVESE